MDVVRTFLPTVSTVLVVAGGALATKALHAGVPGGLVVGATLVLALLVAAALTLVRGTRRRDALDREWAAVEPAWRDGSR